ncbi:MAG TPA: protein TolR [Polyangia bacterium]|nr:protein TolR [Polyangia bacterium]
MAAAGPRQDGGMLAEINVTPLVDVMLVLLIIFMVTAPMIQQGVDVDLPEAKATTMTNDEGKLILTVTKDKRVYLGKMEIAFAEVEEKLKANSKVQQDREVYLHADKRLEYGVVVQVMAAMKNAGVDRLGMVTDPLEQ